MNPDSSSALRTLMKIGGTLAATLGAMSAADIATITNMAEVFFGTAFALWGAIWSVWSKRPKSVEAKQIAAKVEVAGVNNTKEVALEREKVDGKPGGA